LVLERKPRHLETLASASGNAVASRALAQLVLRDPEQPGGSRRSTRTEAASAKKRRGERLPGQIRSQLSGARSPHEQGHHGRDMALVEHAERIRIPTRRRGPSHTPNLLRMRSRDAHLEERVAGALRSETRFSATVA
jgi:hypothetical protein